MTNYKTLTFTKADGIARITLNRPDAANGINPPLAAELCAAAAACDGDRSIRAVIVTANGRFFSAGGDVKAMASMGDGLPAGLKALADDLHKATATLARMPAPVIVAVNGVAAGAGFSLAIAGDIVIAAESAAFTMAYSKVGLSPDGSSSYFLPRLVGLRKAQELMLTNRQLSASEALDYGLVSAVVADDALQSEAEKIAAQLLQASPESNAAIKNLLLQSFANGLETQMEIEGRTIAGCAASANGREGIAAFVGKRRPSFSAG